MSVRYVQLDELLVYVERLVQAQGQAMPPLLSIERLEAALARPESTAFGEDAFPTLAEKAAALLHGIVAGHPFGDANKRAGLAATLLFLELNGVGTDVADSDLYDLTIDVATGREREVEAIARRIGALFGIDGS